MKREAQCSHDFNKYATLGLHGNDEFWDFSSLVDKKKRAVFIGIELLPQSDATENESNLEQSQTCSSDADVPGDFQFAQYLQLVLSWVMRNNSRSINFALINC